MRRPIQDTAAARFFIRQETGIDCAVACLTGVQSILSGGERMDYDFFKDELNPHPDHGCPNADILRVARAQLPVVSAGEGVYDGGLAVANIMHEDEGHFVLMLGRTRGGILYYEPYYHDFILERAEEIDWRSGWDTDREWAINFGMVEGFDADHWLHLLATPAEEDGDALPIPLHAQKRREKDDRAAR